MNKISVYKPDILIFVYKEALKQLLKFGFNKNINPDYGFNDDLKKFLNTEVFVFPIPGVGGVKKDKIDEYITDLQIELGIES